MLLQCVSQQVVLRVSPALHLHPNHCLAVLAGTMGVGVSLMYACGFVIMRPYLLL